MVLSSFLQLPLPTALYPKNYNCAWMSAVHRMRVFEGNLKLTGLAKSGAASVGNCLATRAGRLWMAAAARRASLSLSESTRGSVPALRKAVFPMRPKKLCTWDRVSIDVPLQSCSSTCSMAQRKLCFDGLAATVSHLLCYKSLKHEVAGGTKFCLPFHFSLLLFTFKWKKREKSYRAMTSHFGAALLLLQLLKKKKTCLIINKMLYT